MKFQNPYSLPSYCMHLALLLLVMLPVSSLLPKQAHSQPTLYMTDPSAGKIQRMDVSTGEIEDLITSTGADPDQIALDADGRKMYWVEKTRSVIRRANLDGSDIEDVYSATENTVIHFDVDQNAGKMYWTTPLPTALFRANLDGSDIELLIDSLGVGPTAMFLVSFALDSDNGKMYSTSWEVRPTGSVSGWVQEEWYCCDIRQVNLDGTESEVIVENPSDFFGGLQIELDSKAGVLYWYQGTGEFGRSNLDGTGFEVLGHLLDGSFPSLLVRDLARDLEAGKMYWTSSDYYFSSQTSSIHRANLDGSNVTDLVVDVPASYTSIALDPGGLATALEPGHTLPTTAVLHAAYPSPFNPTTNISYTLPRLTEVTLTVYDVLGRAVKVLAAGRKLAGTHEVRFDATGLPSGLYLYRLETGGFAETKSLVLLR